MAIQIRIRVIGGILFTLQLDNYKDKDPRSRVSEKIKSIPQSAESE